MTALVEFLFLSPFLAYAPRIFIAGTLLLAAWYYARLPFAELPGRYARLVWIAAGFRIAYAAVITVGQYWLWDQADFTRHFLRPDEGGLGSYFLPYAALRYWTEEILAIGIALLFGVFLRLLAKYQARFFEDGEVELGTLAALLVSWPATLVFIALVFAGVILISLFRTIVLKKNFTTLGLPFLFAAALSLLFGDALVRALNLGVLSL